MTATNGHSGAWRAQNNGKVFESVFYSACLASGVAATRIPDGCKVIGKNRLIRVQSPWDWVISYAARFGGLVDTKTTAEKAFPNSAIEDHQLYEMVKHRINGVAAGYVVWTRANKQVFFVDADILLTLRGKRGSISHESQGVIQLGDVNRFDPRRIWVR